ncbi:DUF4224 domain-containing protein [Paraburkholderia sp. RL17-368-BIF-A]|uniref:DUF4224 domain-containing protein n=1 Tax=Paraburkholderia sp. RL17-368-BIF-A TaxID=3031628 RepID=UPI0038C39575
MSDTFLSNQELVVLTGRKLKSKQVEALRRMGLPFFVNACGRPVVTRTAVEGGKAVRAASGWSPSILGAQ